MYGPIETGQCENVKLNYTTNMSIPTVGGANETI